MAIFDGKRIFVVAGTYTYAAQITGGMDVDANMIEVTSKDSSGWREFISGLKGGSITFEGLADLADSDGPTRPFDQLVAGTAVTCYFGEAAGTAGVRWTCSGLVEQLSLTAPNDEAFGYSGTIRVTGAITETTTS